MQIRSERDSLLQSDAIDKSAALRVLQQYHALEELLMRVTHEKEIQRIQQDAASVLETQRTSESLSSLADDLVQLRLRQTEVEEQVRQLSASRSASLARRK
jgi:hypothetical protein